ncbi:beta-ketoacyl synthase N-terminal-like domain-containing protein [Actinoplanes sp. TFC3]|uniref:beta-ketoacyl synthase N-terminal-like domain-containing protein n=1 Tax=Actinoplanes sp. TFC3 TaxID=1710355 RepID=UPI000830A5AD|nr:beta-ketoacyl synthase N-terminal-like domain-containing protein [Actinoplanes sp. TFC3]
MPSPAPEFLITGVGITAAIGSGRDAFLAALLEARHAFASMTRPGRQAPGLDPFTGAEIPGLPEPQGVPARALRTASLSARAALTAVGEAWRDAGLDDVDPARIGLIVGGSNIQQRELVLAHQRHADRPQFIRPTYGMSFLDTDLCGFCTELYGIQGFARTLGGASASGLLAILDAVQAVRSGQVDVAIAVGALMDVSYWELLALRGMGAMGSVRFAGDPAAACRPFDAARDGFIFGEACGAVVVERAGSRAQLGPYAYILGSAVTMDRNRNPDPSLDGEVRVIEGALQQAGVTAADIDYVNPHGTGSPLGDEIELGALRKCGLTHARINATKSVTGHGLSAAGAVEVIATVLQMRAGRLHPTRNLSDPIDTSFDWVGAQAVEHQVTTALSLSMGFSGISSAICLRRF